MRPTETVAAPRMLHPSPYTMTDASLTCKRQMRARYAAHRDLWISRAGMHTRPGSAPFGNKVSPSVCAKEQADSTLAQMTPQPLFSRGVHPPSGRLGASTMLAIEDGMRARPTGAGGQVVRLSFDARTAE